MRSFKSFIKEDETPFVSNPDIGWWGDKNYMDLYHGTHKRNIPSIEDNGINKMDPTTGMVSMTLDPHTAHGYAAMSGAAGEYRFRKSDAKPVVTPPEDRAVTKFRIPMDWAKENLDPNMRGNIGMAAGRLSDRSNYDNWKTANPTKGDHEYYATSEFRFNKPIPPEFYVSHSFKVKKNNGN